MGAMADGAFILLGRSELTDYPISSSMRNQIEPFLKSVG